MRHAALGGGCNSGVRLTISSGREESPAATFVPEYRPVRAGVFLHGDRRTGKDRAVAPGSSVGRSCAGRVGRLGRDSRDLTLAVDLEDGLGLGVGDDEPPPGPF